VSRTIGICPDCGKAVGYIANAAGRRTWRRHSLPDVVLITCPSSGQAVTTEGKA
jgi:ssDNA-binding Zn-finger/Zn-ribbon topoisomerase 1